MIILLTLFDHKKYHDIVFCILDIAAAFNTTDNNIVIQWRNYVRSALRQTFPRRPHGLPKLKAYLGLFQKKNPKGVDGIYSDSPHPQDKKLRPHLRTNQLIRIHHP